MENQLSPCTQDSIGSALQNHEVPEILLCLRRCFDNFRHHFFGKGLTTENLEDIYWNAAFGLVKKNANGGIRLSSSLCAYFRGFMLNYWRAFLRKKNQMPQQSLDETPYDLPDDPAIDVFLLSSFEEEKVKALNHCLTRMDDRTQTIVKGFYAGKKDKEIAAELNISNPQSVSVIRKRCFTGLQNCLRKNFPDLF